MSCGSVSAALGGCGPVCSPISAARKWLLADRVSADRCGLGMEVMVRLDAVPERDPYGRIAHVRGIRFVAEAELEVDGATNDAVSAYQLRSIWSQMFLEDAAGWQFWSALDGRTILDDQYFRHYRMVQWPALYSTADGQAGAFPLQTDLGLGEDIGAGTYRRTIELYAPLARESRNGNPMHGLIPLASLRAAKQGALRFTVRPDLPGAPDGVSLTKLVRVVDGIAGTTADGLEVWLDVVYLDAVVIDAPWQLQNYTLDTLQGELRHRGRTTEYAWIRYFPEDAPQGATQTGQLAVNEHSGITLQIARSIELGGVSLHEAASRMLFTIANSPDSALVRQNGAQELPIFTADGSGYTALMLVGAQPRNVAPAGPVEFNYSSRPSVWTRYVHRTVTCHDPRRADSIQAQTKVGSCTVYGTDPRGHSTPEIRPTEPMVLRPNSMKRR